MISKSVLITFVYLVLFQFLLGFMKLLSLTANEWPEGKYTFLLFSPVPSFRTWQRGTVPENEELLKELVKLILELVLLGGYYSLPSDIFVSDFHWIWQAYLAVVPFVLLVDSLGRLCRVGYGLLGVGVPHIHKNFVAAVRLSDFWSLWNVWFADFLEETCFRPFIRQPHLGVLIAFGGSGIFHEYLVNLPLYTIYQVNLYGTMMAYFLLQGFGLWVERTLLVDRPVLNRVWTWTIVVIPVPLVLNLGSLRIFHLGFF